MSGARFGALLALVFVVLFAATFFLLGPNGLGVIGGSANLGSVEAGDVPPLPPIDVSSRTDRPTEAPILGDTPAPSDEETPTGPGALKVSVIDDVGRAVYNPDVLLFPDTGKHVVLPDGGFELRDLAPGQYRLQIWSGRYVPRTFAALTVNPGRTTLLDVTLQEGIIPAGGVHDEKDRSPIPGASITIGSLRLRTDQSGNFRAQFAIPKSSITAITVEHEDYDTTTYNKIPGLDPNQLQIPMTRGDATLKLRFSNESARVTPSRFRIQLFRLLGGQRRMLKRDRIVTPAEQVALKGIHAGAYQLLVSFPDSDLCAQSAPLRLEYRETKETTFIIDGGADVTGRVTHRRGRVSGRTLTLLDEDAFPYATVHSDAEGRFRIRSVPAGKFRFRSSHGAAPWDTSTFEVSGTTPIPIEVDFDKCDIKRPDALGKN